MQCRHSKMRENIEHEGIITNIRNGVADVQIVQYSACSNCHAQSACNDMDFKIGDKVLIIGNSSIGSQAILIAFFYPFILLFCTLFIIYSVTSDEVLSGILSLTTLIPYYIILYFLKSKLKKKFEFSIKKT